MRPKIIDVSFLPRRIPASLTISTYLLLDRFAAPLWVWIAWGLLAAGWIAFAVISYSIADKREPVLRERFPGLPARRGQR